MKRPFLISILLSLILTAHPVFAQQSPTTPPSNEEPLLEENNQKPFPCEMLRTIEFILNCFGNNQQNLYQLIPVSKIIECDCRIEKLGMLFDYYGPLDIPKARRLALQAVTELLQTVNSSNKLTPFLGHCGQFTPDDIIIRIRWRSSSCGFFYPPLGNVAYVSAMENRIVYDTLNSYTFSLNNLRTESFQEALRLNTSNL